MWVTHSKKNVHSESPCNRKGNVLCSIDILTVFMNFRVRKIVL